MRPEDRTAGSNELRAYPTPLGPCNLRPNPWNVCLYPLFWAAAYQALKQACDINQFTQGLVQEATEGQTADR